MIPISTRRPRWLVARPARPAAALRLVCLPYAGGGTSLFRGWSKLLAPEIEVCAVLLPGREERLSEPACTSLDTLVPLLLEQLANLADKPFALFGHSMGGRIAYALAGALDRAGARPPTRLLLSGCAPTGPAIQRHRLADDDLLLAIKNMNGVPPEVLANPELLELLLPMLRADFTLAETSEPSAGSRIRVPITALAGRDDDEAPLADMLAWAEYTDAALTSHEFAGDHFFLHDTGALLAVVNAKLLTDIDRAGPDIR